VDNTQVERMWGLALEMDAAGCPLVASEAAYVASDLAAEVPLAERGPVAAVLVEMRLGMDAGSTRELGG
jgi:hypothetical protein